MDVRNSYEHEDKENEEPEVLEQFQASSLLDGGDVRDSINPAFKDFDGPSETTFHDGRPVDVSTFDPSGYLASPDGSLIMIRKANSGRMSPVMGKSVKDYEEKMKILRQENFDLRLYCYHLEQKLKDETASQTELTIKRYTVQLETEQTKLQKQLSDKNELLKTASAAIDSLKSENDNIRRELSTSSSDSKTIKELRHRLDELLSERDALQHEVQQLRYQLAEVRFSTESSQQRVKESDDLAKLEESNALLRQRLASSESQVKELAEQLADSRHPDVHTPETRRSQNQGKDDLEDEVQRLNQKYERAVKAIQGFIRKVTKRDKEIEELKKKLFKLTGEHADLGDQDSGIKHTSHGDSSLNPDKEVHVETVSNLNVLHEQVQVLQASLDTRKDELKTALAEADALRRQLSDTETSLVNVRRELENEREDRRRAEQIMRQQEAEREEQLANLQAALVEQEAHVDLLTNRTEGASSALAGYEAVVAERARHLEEVLAAREHALAEAAVEIREMGVQLKKKQDDIDLFQSQQDDLHTKNEELKERLHNTETELNRLRELLQQAEEGLVSRLEQASELFESRDRSVDRSRGESRMLSNSAGAANTSAAAKDSGEQDDSGRDNLQSPDALGNESDDLVGSDIHAEVARLRGLLTEKEETLERLGTPHRGVGRRLFTLHAMPAAATRSIASNAVDCGQLSTPKLQSLHSHIFTLLQTLERAQHLQESFIGDLLTTANESLLQHQQQSMGEPSVVEESPTGDQSIASLSGLSFLLSRLPRTPGGLQGGNVTMTTEGVTMTEEMHELIFERLRDQVDELRRALALCSSQGHSLLQETAGLGSPMRLALDSEDWAALLRRLLQRLEREEGSDTEAVHKDVRLAVGLCRQILHRLDRDEHESPAAASGDVHGALSTSDLLVSPDKCRESKPVEEELSRTVGVVRTRCHALEAENRELRQRLGLKEDSVITSISPFSSGRRSQHDDSAIYGNKSDIATDHESLVQSIVGLQKERSALESELSRFREMCSSHNLSSSSAAVHDSLLDSQVEDVTERLRAMQLDMSIRMKDPDTPRRNKSVLRRETEEARRKAEHLAREAHERELECERLRSTAADLRRQVVSRCDDLEMARLRSELMEMQQRYSIMASDLELEMEKCSGAMSEREQLKSELSLAEKEREAMQLEIEAAREAVRRLEAELGSERSRLCQEVADLSAQLRLREVESTTRADVDREEIHDRIVAIRAQMTQLEAENVKVRSRAEAAERRVMELSEVESCQRVLDNRKCEELEAAGRERQALLRQLEQQRKSSQQELEAVNQKAVSMESLVTDLMEEKQSLLDKLDHLQSQFRLSGIEAEKLASEFTNQINEMEMKMTTMARERDQLHDVLEEARRDRAHLDERLASITSAKEDLEHRFKTLSRTKEESEVRVATLMRNKEETEGRLTALIRNEEELEAKLSGLVLSKKELEEKVRLLMRTKEELETRLFALIEDKKELEGKLVSIVQNKEELEHRFSSTVESQKELDEEFKALTRNKEDIETQLSAMTQVKVELEEKVKQHSITIQELQNRLSDSVADKEETEQRLTAAIQANGRLEEQLGAVMNTNRELEDRERHVRRSKEDVEKEREDLEERVRCLVSENGRLVDDVGHLQAQMQEVEQQRRRLDQQVRELQSVAESTSSSQDGLVETLERQVIELGSNKVEMSKENARLQTVVHSLEEERQKLSTQVNMVNIELESESSRWKSLVADLKLEAGDTERRLKEEKEDLQQENARLHDEMSALNAEQERLTEDNDKLRTDVQELKDSLVQWKESMNALERQLAKTEGSLSQKTDSLTEITRQFEEIVVQRDRAEERIEVLERDIAAMRQSFDSGSEETRTLLTLKSELERRLEETVRQLAERDRAIEELREEKSEYFQHLERIKPEVVNLKSNLQSVNRHRAELKSCLERVQSRVRSSLAEQKAALTSRGIDTSADADHHHLRLHHQHQEQQDDVIDLHSFEAELQKAFTRISVLQESLEQQDLLAASREADLKCLQTELNQARAHAAELESQLQECAQITQERVSHAQEIRQLLDRLAQNEDALQEERDLNSRLKSRVRELEGEIVEKEQQLVSHETVPVPSAKDLRETGEMVRKLEGRVHDLLTENQRWKSAAKELRSKLDTRTTRLESCMKQNARLKTLIKQDEQQAEDRRADLENLTSNVQHKNEAILRLQQQLKSLQREVETSRQRAIGNASQSNVNNSALPAHLIPDDISHDSSSASAVSKEALRKASGLGVERALTPALSDVMSSLMEEECDEEDNVALKSLHAKLRATEYMNQSLQAELSLHSEPSTDRNEDWICTYLEEVRRLRSNLEASIAENDRLRMALERQLGFNAAGGGTTRNERELRRLREKLALQKRRLLEMEERLELAQGETNLLKSELEPMKDLVRSLKAELDLCRPRAEGSVRREMILESQRLRLQMERSIESNRRLHIQLQEQLSQLRKRRSIDLASYPHTPTSSTPRVNLAASVIDARCDWQEVPTKLKTSHEVDHQAVAESVRVDSDFRLLHAIGRLDDFELVRKQVKETLCLVFSVRSRINDRLRHYKGETTHVSVEYSTLKELESEIKNIVYYLEEEDKTIGRFWVAELPPQDHHGRYYNPTTQMQLSETQSEMERLRGSNRLLHKLLNQQEQRLAETDRARNDLECALVERLSSTEHVLSAARDNLKRVADNNDDRMNKTR